MTRRPPRGFLRHLTGVALIAPAVLVAGALGRPGQAVAATAPPALTDLSSIKLAPPTSPGPTIEAAQMALTQYAIDQGALSETFDPDTGIYSILMPPGSTAAPPVSALPVRVTASQYTKAQLDSVVDTITKRVWASDASTYAYAIRIDAAKGMVEVDTTAPAGVTAAVSARYPGIVAFNHVSFASRLARNADAASHYGGARITSGGTGCSAGPSVRIGSTTYGTTAGHCGGNGTVWLSGGYAFGYTNARPDFPNSDTARIATSTYAPRIYYGGTTTTNTLAQVGAGDPAGAIVVTTSGAYGGSTGGTVTDINTTQCWPDGCTSGLFAQNNVSVIPGDSGAVVHTVSGSNAGVRGTLVGIIGPRSYAQRWSRIASALGVDILT